MLRGYQDRRRRHQQKKRLARGAVLFIGSSAVAGVLWNSLPQDISWELSDRARPVETVQRVAIRPPVKPAAEMPVEVVTAEPETAGQAVDFAYPGTGGAPAILPVGDEPHALLSEWDPLLASTAQLASGFGGASGPGGLGSGTGMTGSGGSRVAGPGRTGPSSIGSPTGSDSPEMTPDLPVGDPVAQPIQEPLGEPVVNVLPDDNPSQGGEGPTPWTAPDPMSEPPPAQLPISPPVAQVPDVAPPSIGGDGPTPSSPPISEPVEPPIVADVPPVIPPVQLPIDPIFTQVPVESPPSVGGDGPTPPSAPISGPTEPPLATVPSTAPQPIDGGPGPLADPVISVDPVVGDVPPGALGDPVAMVPDQPGDDWISPGNSPGTLEVNGDFVLDGRTLLFEILGTEAGVDYDQLIVNGEVDLNEGNVVFAFLDAYVPEKEDIFDVILADLIDIKADVDFYYGFFPSDPWGSSAPRILSEYTIWTDEVTSGLAVDVLGSQGDQRLRAQYKPPGVPDSSGQGPDAVVTPVPIALPGAAPLLLAGVLALGASIRRRRS